MTTRRCKDCGKGTIKRVARRGRTARYRTMPRLAIPAAVEIPTCDHCGAEWIDAAAAKVIDAVLEPVYLAELRRRVRDAITELTKYTTSREIEVLLGLSQGYLSKLKSGDHDPSPALVGELGLLAEDPGRRLDELRRYWGHEDAGEHAQ